jgi:hypothetical protein
VNPALSSAEGRVERIRAALTEAFAPQHLVIEDDMPQAFLIDGERRADAGVPAAFELCPIAVDEKRLGPSLALTPRTPQATLRSVVVHQR